MTCIKATESQWNPMHSSRETRLYQISNPVYSLCLSAVEFEMLCVLQGMVYGCLNVSIFHFTLTDPVAKRQELLLLLQCTCIALVFILFTHFAHLIIFQLLFFTLLRSRTHDCIFLYDSEMEASMSEQFSASVHRHLLSPISLMHLPAHCESKALCTPLRDPLCWIDAESALGSLWADSELRGQRDLPCRVFLCAQLDPKHFFHCFPKVSQSVN